MSVVENSCNFKVKLIFSIEKEFDNINWSVVISGNFKSKKLWKNEQINGLTCPYFNHHFTSVFGELKIKITSNTEGFNIFRRIFSWGIFLIKRSDEHSNVFLAKLWFIPKFQWNNIFVFLFYGNSRNPWIFNFSKWLVLCVLRLKCSFKTLPYDQYIGNSKKKLYIQ